MNEDSSIGEKPLSDFDRKLVEGSRMPEVNGAIDLTFWDPVGMKGVEQLYAVAEARRDKKRKR